MSGSNNDCVSKCKLFGGMANEEKFPSAPDLMDLVHPIGGGLEPSAGLKAAPILGHCWCFCSSVQSWDPNGFAAPEPVSEFQTTWTRFEAISLMVLTMQLVHGLNPSVRHAVSGQRMTDKKAFADKQSIAKKAFIEKQIICADLLIIFLAIPASSQLGNWFS